MQMGMMIRHNRLRKAQGAATAAPASSPAKKTAEVKTEGKGADNAVSKRGRKKAE